jgi:hypothetical protein
LLQEGLNQLFNYFAEKDPLNTVCPDINSQREYTLNKNPTIRIRQAGQGIMCVRLMDKAGNKELIWVPINNPNDMFTRIAVPVGAAAAAEILN